MEPLGILLGAKVISDLVKADKMNTKAEKKLVRTFNRQNDIDNHLYTQKNLTEKSLIKLTNRKKGILDTSIKEFILLYEQIGKIKFNNSDGIEELNGGILLPSLVDEMRDMIEVSSKVLSPQQKYATFIFSGVTGLMKKEAELNLSHASKLESLSQLSKSQTETAIIFLDLIYQISEKNSELLARLNLLFRKSIETTSLIIEGNGFSRLNYSQQDKEYIRILINIADAVKKIIDAPLFDKNGEIANKTKETLEVGESYLKQIEMLV